MRHGAWGKISGIRGVVTERATFDNSRTTGATTREREGDFDGISNGLVATAALGQRNIATVVVVAIVG